MAKKYFNEIIMSRKDRWKLYKLQIDLDAYQHALILPEVIVSNKEKKKVEENLKSTWVELEALAIKYGGQWW